MPRHNAVKTFRINEYVVNRTRHITPPSPLENRSYLLKVSVFRSWGVCAGVITPGDAGT